MNLIKSFKIILDFWARYNKDGVLFLINKRFSRKSLILFKNKEYKHPIYLRKNTSDIETFLQVLFNNEYKFSYSIDPLYIIDCGANIGLATIYFKNIFPDSIIISIEPESSNFEILKANTQFYSDIVTYNKAIYNRETILEVRDIGMGNWGFVTNEIVTSNRDIVNSITIEQIMKENHIDFIDILKIDIEGSEKELFESGYEYWLSRCKIIIIEFHDRLKDGCSKSFFEALNKYNYSIWPANENIICILKS